jgi:uncharacterized protein YndB with AHSA1/START domain
MMNTGASKALQVTTPSDREIAMTRVFNAPRRLVFDAWTKPELVKQWLLGPPGWTMPVCEIDLRVGGRYRFVWRGPDGAEMGMGGVHKEIVVPERIVNTQLFDQDWTGGETIGTLLLVEHDGKTTVTNSVLYSSKEARDNALKSGMADGVEMGYVRLDKLLASGKNTANVERRDLVVTRVFDAPVERVWKAWTDPQQVMQWWGPNGFTSPSAQMDFREGGTSLVCMRASKEFGGQDFYSTWAYTKIIPMRSIEYIHNLADKNGQKADPIKLGMPPDFPRDQRHLVTFKDLGNGKTEMTVTEFDWTVGRMQQLAELGLNQCLDKMAAIFAKA